MHRLASSAAVLAIALQFSIGPVSYTAAQSGEKPLRERLLEAGASLTEITHGSPLAADKESPFPALFSDSGITEVRFRLLPLRFEHIEGLDVLIMPRLRDLNREQLLTYKFSDADAVACGKEKTIRVLSIPLTGVTDKFLKEYESLELLTSLDLSFNNITDEGVARLTKAANLKELRLAHTDITDKSAKTIAALTHLEYVDIAHTAVSDQFAQTILAMKQLKQVDISESRLSPALAEELRAKKPPRKRLSIDD